MASWIKPASLLFHSFLRRFAGRTLDRIDPLARISDVVVVMAPLEIVSRYDIVADGSDNFATRYLVNDACYFARKPMVFAALGQFDGYLSTFRAFEMDKEGQPLPSYRCLFPEPPPPGTVASCEEAGVLGPVAGVLGTLQAVETIKEILGIGGKLLMYEALSARFQTIALKWDPDNPLNGRNPTIRDLSIHRHEQSGEGCAPSAG